VVILSISLVVVEFFFSNFVIFHKIKVAKHIWEQCCQLVAETGSRFLSHCDIAFDLKYSFQRVTQPGSASQKHCAFWRQNYQSQFYFGNGSPPSISRSGFSFRIRLSFVLFKNMLDENKLT
jgi:hypothetical protein